nr:hydrogenase maturation protease [Anaerolineae bacterium]
MKTLVIGLGNPILTDDGVGIYAARIVEQIRPETSNLDVVELAVGGLQLMEAMIGYEQVIILDAVWSPNGELGKIVEFDAGYLSETMNSASAHDVDLPMALRVGRRLGADLPVDTNIRIIGVYARTVLDFGAEPTPPVAAAIPGVVNRVMDILGYTPRVDPGSISLSSCWRL